MSEENISEYTPRPLPRTDFELYRHSRAFYVIEALVEYLISLTVSGAFIAKVSTELGLSDSLTGVISAIASLGGLFQIIGIFLSQQKKVKPLVCRFLFTANLFFGLVYVIPLSPLPFLVKWIAFATFMVGGYLLRNILGSPRTRWMMSLIDPRYRGTFNAKKETISLVGGMAYSLLIGSVIDYFETKGDLKTAFLICAITILAFSVSDLVMLILIKEPIDTDSVLPRRRSASDIASALKCKDIWKISTVKVLWAIAYHASIPFFGTYQNKELGFSMTFISIISTIAMISQACSSIPTGRFGDKYGSRTMFTFCLILTSVALVIMGFTTPQNGAIMFILYTIVFHIGVAGTGFGSINLVYEYSPPQFITETLAISTAVSGVAGFLTTTVVSRLVGYIQANGNSFMGIDAYAQQVISFISATIMVIELIYIRLAFKKRKLY